MSIQQTPRGGGAKSNAFYFVMVVAKLLSRKAGLSS